MSDPFTERLLGLGREWDRLMPIASIDRCNCMIRYGGGEQLPAIRHGKNFTTPEGRAIEKPDSFEDMKPAQIRALMAQQGVVYIGHMFQP